MKRLILSFVVILFFAVASAQQPPDYSAYIHPQGTRNTPY